MRNRITCRALYTGAVIVVALLLFSCKPTYELGKVAAKPISDHKLYKKLADSSLIYNSFYAKRFSASFTLDGVKKSFKGAMKIQKDSVIWISINAPVGGIEVARLMITPDSVQFLDRLKKKYFVGDFDFLSQQLNLELDFVALQSILTNSVFEYCKDDNRSFIRNFKGKVVDNQYVFTSTGERRISRKIKKDRVEKLNGVNYQRVGIDPLLFRITDIFVRDFDENRSLSINYSDFMDFSSKKFPQNLSFEVKDSKHSLNCRIKFNKITYDEKLNFPFNISDKYQRIYQ